MSSPLFNAFMKSPSSPVGNFSNFMNQFNQFRNTFSGDPQKEVQALLQSGKMSQAQFNQLSQMAQQIQGMMK